MSVLFILLMHLVNGAQSLNVTPLFLSSACLAATLSPAPVIVIVPFTSMYESAKSHRFHLSIVVFNLIITICIISSLFIIYFSPISCSKF